MDIMQVGKFGSDASNYVQEAAFDGEFRQGHCHHTTCAFSRMFVCQPLLRRRIRRCVSGRPLVISSRFLKTATDASGESKEKESAKLLVDAKPVSKSTKSRRLPTISIKDNDEFPPDANAALRRSQATARILRIAADRLVEPPTLHLLAASATAAMSIAAIEGTILCQEWPFWQSVDAGTFVLRYSVEQLIPSCVWETQDASLVARSLGMDPSEVLRELSGADSDSASALLRTKLLASTRYLVAGFMMIAQLVRAAGVSAGAFSEYEERIRLGREPPLAPLSEPGLVVRLCGRFSFVTEVSLERMGVHLFPVFENTERVQSLVWKHSEKQRKPVYWCVREGQYGSAFSWDRFPADPSSFIKASDGSKLLVLEADATNGNDPLSLSEKALDLTIDDASQGFRRIQERYANSGNFLTIRVYLGNSMEVGRTGGGHSYTLRHRVRYAKEVDVLIDSRAPVLQRILEWCHRVAGKDRKIFFQTSSREYFLNLQKLLKEYGYEIYDPLDLRMLDRMRGADEDAASNVNKLSFLKVLLEDPTFIGEAWDDREFLEYVLAGKGKDKKKTKSEMLRQVAKMAKLPRLVHMQTTAETVNAVEALITAGEVDAMNCCALMDRQEGVSALESILERKSKLVQSGKHEWTTERVEDASSKSVDETPDEDIAASKSGLQIICSSSIHDKLFHQVRVWARMGYSASEIQNEMDLQFHEILKQSHEAQREVEMVAKEERKPDSGEPPDAPPAGPPEEASLKHSGVDSDRSTAKGHS